MKKVVIVFSVALLMCFSLVVAANNFLITSFETDIELTKWDVRKTNPPSTLKQVKQYATEGNFSGELYVPSYGESGAKWPAMIITKEFFPTDWAGYDILSFDYYNPQSYDPKMLLRLTDNKGQRWGADIQLNPGAGRVQIKLPRIDDLINFNVQNVVDIHFYYNLPDKPVTIFFDNIVLEDNSDAKLQVQMDRWKALCGDTTRLLKSNPEFFERWEKIGKLTEASLPNYEKIRLMEQQLNLLERDLSLSFLINESKKVFPDIPFGIAWADSMVKVFPKARDIKESVSISKNYQVELAKNEYESCQIIIMAPADGQGINNLKIVVEKFLSTDGTTFDGEITIAPVGFVKTALPGAYPVDYVGWYPDPILSFLEEINIEPNEVQPFWITVKTNNNTKAGNYRGNLSIESTVEGKSKRFLIPFNFNVWDFQLPFQRTLRTAISVGSSRISSEKAINDFILRYGVNPGNLYKRATPKIEDLVEWKKQGMNFFNIMYINEVDANGKFPAQRKEEIFDILDSYIPLLKKEGLYEYAYIYGFDEIYENDYSAMKEIFDAIKEKYPDLKIMTTARDNTYGEKSGVDAVDIWCPISRVLDIEAAERARARGKEVWWYVCVDPIPPYANFFIECPTIDTRLLTGFHSYHFDVDGFLYYYLNLWTNILEPILYGPYTNWNPKSFATFNGDGSFLCAGPEGMPLSTIRFENFRDGLDDYDYTQILSNYITKAENKGGYAGLVNEAKKALDFSPFIESIHDFSRDYEWLRNRRKEIATLIEKFQSFGF